MITSTKKMLDLESMDKTVPREAPENAILDKVDLKVWIQWKWSPQQIDWVEKVILWTFLEVEPKQIQSRSKLRRRMQRKFSRKKVEWEVPGKVTPPPRPSKTRAPIRALGKTKEEFSRVRNVQEGKMVKRLFWIRGNSPMADAGKDWTE